MASAASTTAAASTGADATQANGASKTTMKSTTTSRSSDGGRKQSPVDNQRRAPAPKAWTSGTNPITQRGSTPVQQNGTISQQKAPNRAASLKDTGVSDQHAHDRLIFLLGASFGSTVTITTKTGDKYEGIMSGSVARSGDSKITLKMTKKQHVSQAGQINGIVTGEAALVGTGPEHAASFEVKDISEVFISELRPAEPARLPNGAGSRFQTDTDISRNQNRAEKELQPWESDVGNDVDLSLESAGAGGWNQFEANKRKFGTSSTYDENLYTTYLDKNNPLYKQRLAEADRIAREIEGSTSTNSHMREERGQALENDGEDEEDKYSGVRRSQKEFPPLNSGTPNAYTPPARRPPTGQATVRGAPVDPAIISAQISRPDGLKTTVSKAPSKSKDTDAILNQQTNKNSEAGAPKENTPTSGTLDRAETSDKSGTSRSINNSVSPHRNAAQENPTENVENKLLDHFKQFANSEKLKFQNQRRAQANQDRTAKLNDLLRFSQSFKLKTEVPKDLVGILAKDPEKQDQIIEKAKKEVEEAKSAAASPAKPTLPRATREVAVPKFDPSTIPPPLPNFPRARGVVPSNAVRVDRPGQQPPIFAGRGMSSQFQQRTNGASQDRKSAVPHTIPAPIPVHDGARLPPTGPAADQSGVSSPHRSSVHTPTSAVSTKFNVKAMEFRPNANAPSFNPTAPSNAPSSPSSVQRTRSVSRAASPSAFFGSRKPKPAAERPSIEDNFNPIKKMKADTEKREAEEAKKLFTNNGGIPNAFTTPPVWTVPQENAEKTYNQAFEKQVTPAISPVQSRSNSTQHVPYQSHVPHHLQNGQAMPQMSTPHRTPSHMQAPHYPPHGEERMQMQGGSPQVYPSPHVTPGQMVYPSPMAHPVQMAYGQQPYFGAQGNQGPMQMRQYHGTPQFMHTQHGQLAAPVMVQQQSSGPYMTMSQSYNSQMPMYSPSPAHAYPHQNGYPSPGRTAPMMMHQNSQQGHHGQPVMYAVAGQGGQMIYQQGSQMAMRGYPPQQGSYASSPHQHHGFPQRAMSNGYGQMPKMMPQQPMPPTGPAQHGYAPVESAGEEVK